MKWKSHLWITIAMLLSGCLTIVNLSQAAEIDARLAALESTNLYQTFESKDVTEAFFAGLRSAVRESSGSDQARAEQIYRDALRAYLDHHPGQRQRRPDLVKEALGLFIEAAEGALREGRIRYTKEVSDLAYYASDKASLTRAFRNYLAATGDEKGRYLALMDYAEGLARFKDSGAESYFDQAVHSRAPRNSVEAHTRYARYLIGAGRQEEALLVLNRFEAADRALFVNIALLRQQLMHALGHDTKAVDAEIAALRKKLQNASGVGPLPKLTAKTSSTPRNLLGLAVAHAFSHSNPIDDSRGPNANTWLESLVYSYPIEGNFTYFAPWVVNGAEVLWNEARGEDYAVQQVIAWAIRNRGNLSHNGGCGCDCYPGAQGQGNTGLCRTLTPTGPQSDWPEAAESAKRWSCVIHGGQSTIGVSHDQMDDSHREMLELDVAGMTWTIVNVANAYVADVSSANTPSGTFVAPAGEFFLGNPAGAQEWRNSNYCAAMNTAGCKVRLGNIYGQLSDPGVCVSTAATGDNWFWARKP